MIEVKKLFDKKDSFLLIAGPCAIEGEEMAFEIAEEILKITKTLNINFVFKGSFKKANRSKIDSFTGRGVKSTGSNQGKVSVNAGELDALVAYKILDKHPRVNAKKLGITGLSRGGNAANMAVEKKFSDVILGEENYYQASLPMASDCFNVAFDKPTPTPAKNF